ncbi:hypothetical protein DFH28DRAFT_1139286 [Melampsora americana]|nr:hypothetical protein DFH28DRAFT_1139286 [Melampsora americana]
MKTRRRDYTVNPRSPPKRRRYSKHKKETLPELSSSSSYPTFFPNISTLPPLPPSPITPSAENLITPSSENSITPPAESSTKNSVNLHIIPFLRSHTSAVYPDHIFPGPSKLPALPNLPTSTSEIKEGLRRLTLLDTETTCSYTTHRPYAPYPTIPTTQFTYQYTKFNPTPLQFPKQHAMSFNVSKIDSGTEETVSSRNKTYTFTSKDLSDARDDINSETKFPHLAKNGSNFMEWKKNTNRALKMLLSIKNYWD